MNTFGNIFRLTTFGESHGEAIGGVVDGMPPGIDIDMAFIQQELNRRRPGQSRITTSRQEADQVELLSGIFEGKSTGCPIGFIVRNQNQHSQDYENMRSLFRPSHADYTYYNKYGIRDHRGGGRSSARITISRCVGGALAKLVLQKKGITVQAYTSQVGHIALERDDGNECRTLYRSTKSSRDGGNNRTGKGRRRHHRRYHHLRHQRLPSRSRRTRV